MSPRSDGTVMLKGRPAKTKRTLWPWLAALGIVAAFALGYVVANQTPAKAKPAPTAAVSPLPALVAGPQVSAVAPIGTLPALPRPRPVKHKAKKITPAPLATPTPTPTPVPPRVTPAPKPKPSHGGGGTVTVISEPQ